MGLPHGDLRVHQPQRLILDRRRRGGDVESRLSRPEGSIRFIVSVPSCANNPRKLWTALPERVRLAAAFRLACGERSDLATRESRVLLPG